MNEPAVLNLPSVTPYQRKAIFCPERSAVIEATTKAGKTHGCILWLLHMAGVLGLDKPAREFWWVAPIYGQAEIAFGRARTMLLQADPAQMAWTPNESKLSISLVNGATLRFKSAEKPDGLYGEDVYAAVMDEASRCREEAWHAVRSTLTATSGRVRIIGNVKGRKNWAYAMARRVEGGSLPGWSYSKITAHDAVREKILTAQDVEDAKAELPEDVFRELYLAEPSEDGSNPFGMQHIAACVRSMSTGEPVAFGVDLGQADDWTVVIGIDEGGNVCAFERWRRIPWAETTSRILSMIGECPALVDATGVGKPVVEALQAKAPQVEGFLFTSPSKQNLMGGLAVAIQSGEVSYPDGVVRVELEAFEYEHSLRAVRYSAPAGMHDDCVCALALAVQKRATRPRFHFFVGGADEKPEMALPDGSPMNIGDTLRERRRDIHFGFGD